MRATAAGTLFRWESVCLVLWCITCTLPAGHGGFLVPAFGLRLVIVGGLSPHLCFSEERSSLAASLDFGLTERTNTTGGQFQVPSLFCLLVLLLNQPETPLADNGEVVLFLGGNCGVNQGRSRELIYHRGGFIFMQ